MEANISIPFVDLPHLNLGVADVREQTFRRPNIVMLAIIDKPEVIEPAVEVPTDDTHHIIARGTSSILSGRVDTLDRVSLVSDYQQLRSMRSQYQEGKDDQAIALTEATSSKILRYFSDYYMPSIVKLARKLAPRQDPTCLQEYIHDGMTALLETIENWDISGANTKHVMNSCSTYALLRARGAMIDRQRGALDGGIRVTRRVHRIAARITQFELDHTRFGVKPTDSEIAAKLELKPETVASARAMSQQFNPVSLDGQIDTDSDHTTTSIMYSLAGTPDENIERIANTAKDRAVELITAAKLSKSERRSIAMLAGVIEHVPVEHKQWCEEVLQEQGEIRPYQVAERLGVTQSLISAHRRAARVKFEKVDWPSSANDDKMI